MKFKNKILIVHLKYLTFSLVIAFARIYASLILGNSYSDGIHDKKL